MGEKYDLDEILDDVERDQGAKDRAPKGKVNQADIQKLIKARQGRSREEK